MESQPQNPEFKNNPENFHPCNKLGKSYYGNKLSVKASTMLNLKMQPIICSRNL